MTPQIPAHVAVARGRAVRPPRSTSPLTSRSDPRAGHVGRRGPGQPTNRCGALRFGQWTRLIRALRAGVADFHSLRANSLRLIKLRVWLWTCWREILPEND
jgi:hypothetical protein